MLLELLVFLWRLFLPEGDLRGRFEGDSDPGPFRRLIEVLVGLLVRVLVSMEEGVSIFRSVTSVFMEGPCFTTFAMTLSPAAWKALS